MKIFFLGNYTQEFIAQLFKRNLIDNIGIDADVMVSGFDQYRQEIINIGSSLYEFKPDIVFLSLDLYVMTEEIILSTNTENLSKLKSRLKDEIQLLEKMNNSLSSAKIYVDNFYYHQGAVMQTMEYNSIYSYKHFEHLANIELLQAAENMDHVTIVDVHSLIKKHGAEKLFDNRMYYLSRSHWSHIGLEKLTKLYTRYLRTSLATGKKVIVLDIDNTLWGGIIGDDGIDKIKLSRESEGRAFYDFQRELLKLHERGILLAINSMNTEEIVLETMNSHPDMILRPEHFVCLKIDWRNKAQKMKEIASELNLGTDSFVFLDDSPYEREMIRRKFPGVFVPELPDDYAEYPSFIRSIQAFDRLEINETDLVRNKSYKANTERRKLQNEILNIEDFYFSLKMNATVGKANSKELIRVAQMTQKTNQFNLRTIRYTEQEINALFKDPDVDIFVLKLSDIFGDMGIVGAAIITNNENTSFIDSFIFSCRALGRTAETAFLNYIIGHLSQKGIEQVSGEFIPTKKNKPSSDFYEKHNFKRISENQWEIILSDYIGLKTPWISMKKPS